METKKLIEGLPAFNICIEFRSPASSWVFKLVDRRNHDGVGFSLGRSTWLCPEKEATTLDRDNAQG